MKAHTSKNIRSTLWAGVLTLLIASGISGCGVYADPGLRPGAQPAASNGTATVMPLQPGSREWNDANWGDTGL